MPDKVEETLEQIDEQKRDTVRTLIRSAAFAAPIVSSFAIDGKMSLASAGSNTTSS